LKKVLATLFELSAPGKLFPLITPLNSENCTVNGCINDVTNVGMLLID